MTEPLDAALAKLRPLLLDPEGLVRAVASGRRRNRRFEWGRVEVRPVDLVSGRCLQLVRYNHRQAHTSNSPYDDAASAEVDRLLAEPFGNWHVESIDATVQLRVTKKGEAQVHRASTSRPAAVERSHDRAKPRLIDPAEPFLHAVGITDANGVVKPTRQDKYRQIEQFVRALEPVLEPVLDSQGGDHKSVRVVDLGCGNAYLTLAAYRHLTGTRQLAVDLVGVDVKAQARQRNGKVVADLGWADHVQFVEGTILEAPVEAADVVLALHACDTATDEALARAVRWQAPVVLAAPCCHHDVQRQLKQGGVVPEPYAPLARFGILRERFADVLTDAVRAALLRLLGYRVEVVEFVESKHTPRNTLIRAVRTGAPPTAELIDEYLALTKQWGITPKLQTLLEPELA